MATGDDFPPTRATASPGPLTATPPAEGVADVLPEAFGRYRILKRLGQGGMGAVYLAHDSQLDRAVALKVPRVGAADPESVERFYREARAAATLDHPNLCPVFDVGQVGGRHYLTMAYVEGSPLSELIKGGRPLPPRPVADLVRKLALALQEAHARGVIHRDLKPANVMISRRKEPVILDFGLARQVRKEDVRLTSPGTLLGTPAYMPPEQVRGDPEAMGPVCDVYSLGVVLYEMLTSRLPFAGPTLTAMISQVLTQEPPRPSSLRPDLDPRLEAVCLKAMAKDPAARYASMADFAAALGAYLNDQPETEDLLPATTSAPGVGPSQDRGLATQLISELIARLEASEARARPRWPWIAAAGLLAAAAVVLAIVLFNRPEPPPTVVVYLNLPAAAERTVAFVVLRGPAGEFRIARDQLHEPITLPVGDYTLAFERKAAVPASATGSGNITRTADEVGTFSLAADGGEKIIEVKPDNRIVVVPREEDSVARKPPDRQKEPRPPVEEKPPPDADPVGPIRAPEVKALVDALFDESSKVRKAAADGLLKREAKAAATALVKRIGDDTPNDSFYRDKDAALAALKTLGPGQVAGALTVGLRSKSNSVRAWAAQHLLGWEGRINDEDRRVAVKALAERVGNEDPDDSFFHDKNAALEALKALAPAEQVTAALVAAARSKSSANVRTWAVRHLLKWRSRIGEEDKQAVVKLLAERVGNEDPDDSYYRDKDAALEALKILAPAKVTGPLVAALQTDSDSVRAWAARRLAGWKQKMSEADRQSAVKTLADRVGDDTPDDSFYHDKEAALKTLKELAPDRVGEALRQAARSKNERVRTWAAERLSPEKNKP